jgi:hypothetical protein
MYNPGNSRNQKRGTQKNSGSLLPQKADTVRNKPGTTKTAWDSRVRIILVSLEYKAGPPHGGALTSTILLIWPVPTVILPVTFPPVGDAVAILTPELEVAGAVWGFCGVFCGDQPYHQSFPLYQCKHKTPPILKSRTTYASLPEKIGQPHELKRPQITPTNSMAPRLPTPNSCFSNLHFGILKMITEF